MSQHYVSWFLAIEEATFGHPHLHALVAGSAGLRTVEVQRGWNAGRSRMTVIREPEAAVRYVVKTLGRYPEASGVSDRLIRKDGVSQSISTSTGRAA